MRYGNFYHFPSLSTCVRFYYPSIIRKKQERLSACSGPSTGSTAVKSLHSSLSRLKPPAATCSVNPAAFTHNMVDALWFIWFIGIFEFIGGLHEAGILPVWFLIP